MCGRGAETRKGETERRGGIKEQERGRGREGERRNGALGAHNNNNISGRYSGVLTVGPLDVYAAADVDVARTVIHGHLVGPAHLVRHHKTRPASSVN